MRWTHTARISGSTQTSSGQPLRGGMVMVMPKSTNGAMMVGGMLNGAIRPDGTFTVNGVTPGEYTLRANGPQGPGSQPETLTASVTVSGDDVSGVLLAVTPPVK